MLLTGVISSSETHSRRVAIHNFKVSAKIITISSLNTSKEPHEPSRLLRSHGRNHEMHSADYHYYSFKLSALISSCRVIGLRLLCKAHQKIPHYCFLSPGKEWIKRAVQEWRTLILFTCSKRYQCRGCGLWRWQTHVGNGSGCFLEWREGPRAPGIRWWRYHCQCASSSITIKKIETESNTITK